MDMDGVDHISCYGLGHGVLGAKIASRGGSDIF